MKITLTNEQTETVMKAVDALRKKLDHEQIPIHRFRLSADSVSAFGRDGIEVGFLQISGVSAGNSWTSSKQHCSQSIRVDLAA